MEFYGYSDQALEQQLSAERFTVTYRVGAASEHEALEKVRNLTVEQTVEFPAEHIDCPAIQREIIGRWRHFHRAPKANGALW